MTPNFLIKALKGWKAQPLHLARLLVVLLCFVFADLQASENEWSGVSRIVAVGDIHGDYDNYRAVLLQAKVVNKRGNWVAGDTHLVQLGDLADRGADTNKVIDHLTKLQRQAEAAGGKVHVLIGNHEAMNMLGDLTYVHPGEYSAFRNSKSRQLRSRYFDNEVNRLKSLDNSFVADKAFSTQWLDAHPLGYVEHRQAWQPSGDIGAWVLNNNVVVKINRTLFLHGGISPAVLPMSITEINQKIRAELDGNLGEDLGLSESEDSPLWYRGLANNPEVIEASHVDSVLQAYDVDRIVIGHTPGHGIVLPRFAGKVIIVDTGIADYYGGHIASLLIETDSVFAVQSNQVLSLPSTEDEVLPYLERAAALSAPTAALESLIESLKR